MVTKNPDINKIMDYINGLSKHRDLTKEGVTRLLFDEYWISAQNWLEDQFKIAGLCTYYDDVGNLYGRFEGDSKNTIMTGSHVDTVISGGKYDGQYGIVAGLVAIEYLKSNFGKPKKSIEVVSMAEEEGSRFPFTFWGSKNIIGKVPEEEVGLLIDEKGVTFKEALKSAGFSFKNNIDTKTIDGFIELHIEQGGVLEIENKTIGIVEHIVGQKRYLVTLKGEANHAGTTPMKYRKDSIHCASRMVCMIMERARTFGEPIVATVGKLEIDPNTSNVVPGRVTFTLDIRHIDKNLMGRYIEEIMNEMKDMAREMKLDLKVEKYMNGDPVPMSSHLVRTIKGICEEKGIDFKMMHSGAGHDAQIMALKVPTALIFVPSHKGISHNPEEYTRIEDLGEGVKTLIETLYKLAYE